MLYSHDHSTYTYTYRNIFNTIRTSEDTSLEKYTSHFIERVVCERELETEQRLQYIDPKTLLAITAFLSHSPGLLNWGPGGPALCWELVPTAQSGTLTSSSELQLIWTSCHCGYIIVLCPLNSTWRQSRPSPDLLISLTGCTCNLHRCISYFDSLAGSEVNIQQSWLTESEQVTPVD